jgi:rhodanese-related sulfurtransferase
MVLLSAGLCQAKDMESISGKIISGYRILPLTNADNKVDFTVYRGDYIKFSYPQTLGSLPFAMPDLAYKGSLLADPAKSSFFKMKAVGSYTFSLGPFSGSIRVIDLVRPNYTEVTAKQASEILQNIKPFILDVRTPIEYSQIYLPGSHLIPIQELQSRIGELESKKHEDIFIYCATGNRSTVAARILADRGFKRIYNLRYGVYDWARQGYPYATGKK